MTDLTDFQRRVYEPETAALRASGARLDAALRLIANLRPTPCRTCLAVHVERRDEDGIPTTVDPVDGHPYRAMRLQEFARAVLRGEVDA